MSEPPTLAKKSSFHTCAHRHPPYSSCVQKLVALDPAPSWCLAGAVGDWGSGLAAPTRNFCRLVGRLVTPRLVDAWWASMRRWVVLVHLLTELVPTSARWSDVGSILGDAGLRVGGPCAHLLAWVARCPNGTYLNTIKMDCMPCPAGVHLRATGPPCAARSGAHTPQTSIDPCVARSTLGWLSVVPGRVGRGPREVSECSMLC